MIDLSFTIHHSPFTINLTDIYRIKFARLEAGSAPYTFFLVNDVGLFFLSADSIVGTYP